MSQQIERIQKQVNKVAEKVYSNELKMDKHEQYSRSNCLIFHGCSNAPQGNDYEAFENHVINKLNSKLNLPTNLQNSDLDICHSLPSRSNKKPIIIKFVRRSMRNMVFFNKKKLKSNDDAGIKLLITECLTKRRLKLMEESRNVFGFKNVWSFKGNIYFYFFI